MIVKMKFLSISGPRSDIDRVCEVYLSRHEMQLENAIAELKTTENLLPFVEVNPYREPLNKAEEFMALLPDPAVEPDLTMDQDAMISMIRDLNHQYLELVERKERLKKHVDAQARRTRSSIPCILRRSLCRGNISERRPRPAKAFSRISTTRLIRSGAWKG